MKTLCILLAAAAVLLFVRHLAAGNTSTQEFAPARYALLEASVNVSSVLNSGAFDRGAQKTVLKSDTRTGQVWVLQLAVNGVGDPTVCSAVWARVQDQGTFYRSGPPSGN